MIERIAMLAALAALAGCGDTATTAAENVAVENETDAALLNASPLPAPAPVEPGREPLGYTSLRAADCTLVEKNEEEAGYSRHRCKGLSGYTLETTESDLRQDVVVIAPGGSRSELGLSSKVAKGAFNTLGPTAEWRGKDAALPTALIVRLGVANGAEPNGRDTSNLVVIKLKPSACVVKVVSPGPGQNDIARDAADGPDAPCL